MNKKAQSISIQTIIIAIIALAVLAILVLVFTGFFANTFNPGIVQCESRGGQCTSSSACEDAGGRVLPGKASCTDTTQVCCIVGLG